MAYSPQRPSHAPTNLRPVYLWLYCTVPALLGVYSKLDRAFSVFQVRKNLHVRGLTGNTACPLNLQ